MSSFRLLSLLVAVVLVVCAGVLPASVVDAQYGGDPTSACYDASGDPSYGNWVTDLGYYQVYSLESYYSSTYSVMCAWRGKYGFGPNGTTQVWGPWHGNNTDTNCGVHGTTTLSNVEYCSPNRQTVATRTNSATGKRVITSFKVGTSCDDSLLCAGNCPPFSANYSQMQAQLESDPTYEEYVFPDSGSANQVITNLNSTGATVLVKDTSGIYPIVPVSVISSVQYCYGFVDQPCPSNPSQ